MGAASHYISNDIAGIRMFPIVWLLLLVRMLLELTSSFVHLIVFYNYEQNPDEQTGLSSTQAFRISYRTCLLLHDTQ